MKNDDLIKRIDYLFSLANAALATRKFSKMSSDYVETGLFVGFRSSALSFISNMYSTDHIYYKEFDSRVENSYVYCIESGVNILNSIKGEIINGWLILYKNLVTAELFSDFLEMSKYLLDQKYKDAAGVMIGSILEEHLRILCKNNSIEITYKKDQDIIPKKADTLNSDLVKASIYGVLEQKNITAWLDLRNKAAHGKYTEYTIDQVNLMYQGVLDFIMRFK